MVDMKYYIDVDDSYSVALYKTDGNAWWHLGGWSTPDGDEVLFTPCKKPGGRLILLENVFTGGKDFMSGKVVHKE